MQLIDSNDFCDELEWQRRIFRQASAGQLAMANLVIIFIYLLIGAIVYAKYKQQSFVGGLFSSYQLMTTSSNQFPLAQRTKSSQQNLHSKQHQQQLQPKIIDNGELNEETSKNIAASLYDQDFFALFECLYLWIGLNLISCFMQSVRIKLDSWRHLQLNGANMHDNSGDADDHNSNVIHGERSSSSYANCNGHMPLQLINRHEEDEMAAAAAYLHDCSAGLNSQLKMTSDTQKFANFSSDIPTTNSQQQLQRQHQH